MAEGLPYKNIQTGGDSPPWWATNATGLVHPVGDLFLTTYCIEHGWGAAETCWIAGLLMQPHVLIRRTDWDDMWYFPIADLGFPVVLLRADEIPSWNGQR